MPPCAVVTFLGFPGWGALHVVLRSGTAPAALALRLEPLRPLIEAGPASALLPAFLRRHERLQPLPGAPEALAGPQEETEGWISHRYLIVYRCGAAAPLRITAWRCLIGRRIVRICGPLPLPAFLECFTTQGEPLGPQERVGRQERADWGRRQQEAPRGSGGSGAAKRAPARPPIRR